MSCLPMESLEEPRPSDWIPTVTSSSVFALSFKNGVVVAADSGTSHGGVARFKGVNRLYRVNELCVISFSGDCADFQFIQNLVERRQEQQRFADPRLNLTPKMVYSYLTDFFYHRRSKLDPLQDTIIVAGLQPTKPNEPKPSQVLCNDGGKKNYEPFIGAVMERGSAIEVKSLATGIGSFLANQMLETEWCRTNGQLEKEEAEGIMKRVLEVAYNRDCNASREYNVAYVELGPGGIPRAVINLKLEKIASNWDISEKTVDGEQS